MEKPQTLSPDHPQAVDAVYFNSSNSDGEYVVGATARRHGGLVQTALFVRTKEFGLLQLPIAPNSHLQGTQDAQFAAGGLVVGVEETMKKWKLFYSGKLSVLEEGTETLGSEVEAELELTWTACTGHFDFDTDMSPTALAKAIAREPWSREFFQSLQSQHQTHYEQFGIFNGTIKINGARAHSLKNLKGVRDHSYGNVRDWNLFHRYTMHFFHLEDGTCANIGIVSIPDTMSRLEFGYVFLPDGTRVGVDSVSLPLHLLGETTPPPDTFRFSFSAGGKEYRVMVEVLCRPVFKLGSESEATILEQMCRFSVNGQR